MRGLRGRARGVLGSDLFAFGVWALRTARWDPLYRWHLYGLRYLPELRIRRRFVLSGGYLCERPRVRWRHLSGMWRGRRAVLRWRDV